LELNGGLVLLAEHRSVEPFDRNPKPTRIQWELICSLSFSWGERQDAPFGRIYMQEMLL
jgi:hypothetical protein